MSSPSAAVLKTDLLCLQDSQLVDLRKAAESTPEQSVARDGDQGSLLSLHGRQQKPQSDRVIETLALYPELRPHTLALSAVVTGLPHASCTPRRASRSSDRPPVCLSVCLFVCLFVCLSQGLSANWFLTLEQNIDNCSCTARSNVVTNSKANQSKWVSAQ